MLTEHYAGLFPLWLAPEQLRILPVTDESAEYAGKTADRIRTEGLRVEVDDASEKLGARIRKGEMEKIPYLAVVGEKEKDKGTVSLRRHGGTDLGEITVEEAATRLKNEVESKATNS
jgi:threonyl-tRNA synthetase